MTKHVTPPTSRPLLSWYSANENAGDTTQIRGTKNPTQARTKSAVSSDVLSLTATLTLRLRRPCGARMTTITSVAVSTSVRAIHVFMAEHRPVCTVLQRHRCASVRLTPALNRGAIAELRNRGRLTRARREVLQQPRLGHRPVALHGRGRYAERVGGLGDAEAGEEAQLDDAAETLIQ